LLVAPVSVAQVTDITVATAHEMCLDGDFAFVLDVRSANEFLSGGGHIPGAYNIPHTSIGARIDEIMAYQNRRVLVYCGSGYRSGLAAAELDTDHGFAKVYNMLGGFGAWVSAGYETATGGVFGDVDRNGWLDASDVQLVINAALNLTVPFDCDLSGDGSVDAVDVQLVINGALWII